MRISQLQCVALLVFTAGCGGGGGSLGPSSDSGAPISVGAGTNATFGTILVGTDGKTLYTRAGDGATLSTCTDQCAVSWPPLTVTQGQQAVGGPGVDGMFAALTRPDGTLQATYDDRPLYYWHGDRSAGDVTGDGIDGFSVARP